MVREGDLNPHGYPQDPKSCASASSATLAPHAISKLRQPLELLSSVSHLDHRRMTRRSNPFIIKGLSRSGHPQIQSIEGSRSIIPFRAIFSGTYVIVLWDILYNWSIHSQLEPISVADGNGQKVPQQGRSQFDARSVLSVREHGKMARTPLAFFFNIPLIAPIDWGKVKAYEPETALPGYLPEVFWKGKTAIKDTTFSIPRSDSATPPAPAFSEKIKWWTLDRPWRLQKIRDARDQQQQDIII